MASSIYSVRYEHKTPKSDELLQEKVDDVERRLREFIGTKYGFEVFRKSTEALKRTFQWFDADDSGHVDLPEFIRAMHSLNFFDMDDVLEAMFDRYDVDDSGVLSYHEFSDGVYGKKPVPLGSPESRDVVSRIRQALRERGGGTSFRAITLLFRRMDTNGNHKLSRSELQDGFAGMGINTTEKEMDIIMKYFDREGDGSVSVEEMVKALRPTMTKWRRQLVDLAYKQLDRSGKGMVTFADLKRAFRTEGHPEVMSGEKTEEEVLADFITSWDKDADGMITPKEFLDYYKDISAMIEDDDHFTFMMRNTWRIPDEKSQTAITANLRVLVTYDDGQQEVVTIEDDMGIDRNNRRQIEKALLKQGIRGVKKVSTAL
eukprot:Sspe_Gene.37848::Locus_18253_Transcript_1_2_Confidence_0.667_Length_1207::g.37848::m.37848